MEEISQKVEQNTQDILVLKQRADGHDNHLAKLDSEIAGLHARFDSVATKEDIAQLQQDFNVKFGMMFTTAINAIPPWAFIVFVFVTVILAGVAFVKP